MRKHYAKWSPARQIRIDELIARFVAVQSGSLKKYRKGFSKCPAPGQGYASTASTRNAVRPPINAPSCTSRLIVKLASVERFA